MNSILIAYFSRGGMNYVGGDIVDLPVGNTKIAAQKIAKETGGTLFEIKEAVAYPYEYVKCTQVAKKELAAGARPKLAANIGIDDYDTIILGYPNWWGTMPMPVWSFLDGKSFSGKTLLPFCTNEGSGMGVSERDLKKLCGTANVKKGLAICGESVITCDSAINKWLNENLNKE